MWHYMAGNKGCRIPGTCIVVDTETYANQIPGKPRVTYHTLRCGYAIAWRNEHGKATRRKELAFTDSGAWWDWLRALLDSNRPAWLFAHNLAFDFTVLKGWGQIESGELDLKSLVDNDPPTIVRLNCGKAQLICVDTLNYYRCSLKELGESLGLHKLEVSFDNGTQKEVQAYCKRDTEIVERAVLSLLSFHRKHDLGVFKATAAGIAMQAYRHRFAPRFTVNRLKRCKGRPDKVVSEERCLPILHDHQEAKGLEREAYFGGECRLFYRGRVGQDADIWSGRHKKALPDATPVLPVAAYHLDINSLFPSVMRLHTYPYKLVGYVRNPTVKWLTEAARQYDAIASVELNTPIETFPIHCEGRAVYCTGRFHTCLAGAELRYALQLGLVTAVECCAVYKTADLFTPFVDYLWTIKSDAKIKGERAEEAYSKLLLNSLYGKFGQYAWKWRNCPKMIPPLEWGRFYRKEAKDGTWHEYRCIDSLVQEDMPKGESPNSFVAIAACVTAMARQRMRDLRRIAGPQCVIYQDCDSLHVTHEGFCRLMQAGEVNNNLLGKLKLVEEIRYAEYRDLKNYTVNGRHVISGLSMPEGADPRQEQEQLDFQRLVSIISQRPAAGVFVKKIKRQRVHEFIYGVVDKRGWVRPYDLPLGGISDGLAATLHNVR